MASGSDATSGTGQPDDARQRIVADDGAGALVVVPTFNERDNLPAIIKRLHTALPGTHVLVVDDSSPDLSLIHI